MNFPAPRQIAANGISLALYEMGPADGLPVVLVHGFPELAYSWRHQLLALAAAGYRVIAPDMRGFGGSAQPTTVDAYDIHHLTGDLAGVLDALGLERAVFAGHDWGGIVVWQMALLKPQRCAGIIALNTPFLPRPRKDPITLLRAAYGDEMYILVFQQVGYADALLAADVARSFRFFMRKNAMTAGEYAALPSAERNLALMTALQTDEASWRGTVLLNAAELAVFVNAYRRTGFTGGLNYYRNLSRNWQITEGVRQHVEAPSLMVMAADDLVLTPAMAAGMEAYVPDLEKVLIADCGHWTQQEKPQETNRAMLDWLKRRFPTR